MTELVEAIVSWRSLVAVLAVFGFAPGFVLRLLVKIYPKDDPRRKELVADLYVIKRVERPLFVAEQIETVLFEGVPHRIKALFRFAVAGAWGMALWGGLVRYVARHRKLAVLFLFIGNGGSLIGIILDPVRSGLVQVILLGFFIVTPFAVLCIEIVRKVKGDPGWPNRK